MIHFKEYLLIVAIFANILVFLLGLFVLLKNFRNALNRNFFLICLSLAGWVFSASYTFFKIYNNEPISMFIFFRLIWAFSIFLGFSFLTFSLNYEPKSRFTGFKNELLIYIIPISLAIIHIIGLQDAVLTVFNNDGQKIVLSVRTFIMTDTLIKNGNLFGLGMNIQAGIFLYALPLFVPLVLSGYIFVKKYKKQKTIEDKNKLKLIAFGAILVFIFGWPFGNILPMFFSNIDYYGIALISPVFLLGFMGYNIVKHKALEIETIIHKTLMWGLTIIAMATPVFVLTYYLYEYFMKTGVTLLALFLLFMVWVSMLINKYIKPVIDRFFNRNKVDYNIFLHNLSQRVLSSVSTAKTSKYLDNSFVDELHTKSCLTYLLDTKTKRYVLHNGNIQDTQFEAIDIHSPLIQYLKKDLTVLESILVKQDEKFNEVSEFAFFEKTETEVLFPFFFNKEILGFQCLSRKSNLKAYSKLELKVFKQLIPILGISYFNALNQESLLRNKLIEHDINIAEEIQKSVMSGMQYTSKDIEIKIISEPLAKVSGDYYNVKNLNDNETLVVLADVSGKGISAALIVMMIQTILINELLTYKSLSILAKNLNEILYSQLQGTKFVTAVFLEIDKKSRKIKLLNCGHEAILLATPNGKEITKIESSGIPLGVTENINPKEDKLKIPEKTSLVMFTDGLTEMSNKKGEQFAVEGISKTFLKNKPENVENLAKIIIGDAENFAQGNRKSDDMTLIAIQV